jgi:hypothetical protein
LRPRPCQSSRRRRPRPAPRRWRRPRDSSARRDPPLAPHCIQRGTRGKFPGSRRSRGAPRAAPSPALRRARVPECASAEAVRRACGARIARGIPRRRAPFRPAGGCRWVVSGSARGAREAPLPCPRKTRSAQKSPAGKRVRGADLRAATGSRPREWPAVRYRTREDQRLAARADLRANPARNGAAAAVLLTTLLPLPTLELASCGSENGFFASPRVDFKLRAGRERPYCKPSPSTASGAAAYNLEQTQWRRRRRQQARRLGRPVAARARSLSRRARSFRQ